MKNVEIEFGDSLKILSTKENVVFNVKMNKIPDEDNYNIKVMLKCEKRNRRNTYSTVDSIEWSNDYRKDIDTWLKKNSICDLLKKQLKVKLENNFEYKDIL